jgi:hypothetical protein
MFDVDTDPSFPSFATTAEIPQLQAQESMMRQDSVARALRPFNPVEMTDSKGRKFTVLGRRGGRGEAAPWELYSVNDKWYLKLGRIFKDPGDVESVHVILKASEPLTMRRGGAIWLEITKFPEYEIELKSGPQWEGFPQTYEMTDATAESISVLKVARILLWDLSDKKEETDGYEGVQIAPTLYGRQVRRSADTWLVWGARSFNDGTHRRATLPVLISL